MIFSFALQRANFPCLFVYFLSNHFLTPGLRSQLEQAGRGPLKMCLPLGSVTKMLSLIFQGKERCVISIWGMAFFKILCVQHMSNELLFLFEGERDPFTGLSLSTDTEG